MCDSGAAAFSMAAARARPEPDRRLNGQATRLARVFTFGSLPFPADCGPRERAPASGGVAGGRRDRREHADAFRREITRRKWLTRRIQYAIAAHFLRIGRILHINQPARLAGGSGSGQRLPRRTDFRIPCRYPGMPRSDGPGCGAGQKFVSTWLVSRVVNLSCREPGFRRRASVAQGQRSLAAQPVTPTMRRTSTRANGWPWYCG